MARIVAKLAGLLLCTASILFPAIVPAESSAGEDRVWLGVLIDGESLDGGILLMAVIPGGPAAAGGLQRGDVLLEADGRGLVRGEDLESALSVREPGDRVSLKLLRAGATQELQVELASRPSGSWTYLAPRPAEAARPSPPALPSSRTYRRAAAYGFAVTDVTPDLRAYYGAPEEIGVLVTQVKPGHAAQSAGIRVGDVLVRLGAVEVRCAADVDDLLPVGTVADETIDAWVVRDNRSTVARLAVPEVKFRKSIPTSLTAREGEFETLERLIQLEIDQLTRRLEELEGRLEQLREAEEAKPER